MPDDQHQRAAAPDFLCVGGPWDGRRVQLEADQERFAAPAETGPVAFDPGRTTVATVTYRKLLFQAPDHIFIQFRLSLFAPETMSPADVLQALERGYAPMRAARR